MTKRRINWQREGKGWSGRWEEGKTSTSKPWDWGPQDMTIEPEGGCWGDWRFSFSVGCLRITGTCLEAKEAKRVVSAAYLALWAADKDS